ncbi:MAG: hypothetical protein R3B91_07060 [Planctomycetaceae bacterium]
MQSVLELYQDKMRDSEDISDLCIERIAIESLEREITESINDFVTREYLTPAEDNAEAFVFARRLDDDRVAKALFDCAKAADSIERILIDQEPSEYEHKLYKSRFGQSYVSQLLLPQLQEEYHVNADMPNLRHLFTALEASPTAARVAQLMKAPPSVLVHSDLLQFASVAGVCADLISDPELILNTEYRTAVSQLFEASSQRLPQFLLFIKELALIQASLSSRLQRR